MAKTKAVMPPEMADYGLFIDKVIFTLGPYFGEEVYVDDIRLVKDFPGEPGANQIIEGREKIICSLQEVDGGLLEAASEFAGENFGKIELEEALDAVGELLNFISGSYAEEMSKRGTVCELHPPNYGVVPVFSDAEPICRMGITAGKRRLCFIVGVLRH